MPSWPCPLDSQLGEAVAFFLYDVPKILLLLAGMIFLISILRTFFSWTIEICGAPVGRGCLWRGV